MPLKLPPDDDPLWDIVRKHGMSVTVFKVVLRALAKRQGVELGKASEDPEEEPPDLGDN